MVESQERSDAARRRASEHGELPGTPENIEGIERAEKQADKFQANAHDQKPQSLISRFLGMIVGL